MAGLYLHIPFCAQRCTYCDFYFVTSQRDVEDFAEAACLEIERAAESSTPPEPIETVYFGGGTPSLLHLAHLDRILATVRAGFRVAADAEITLEMNPDGVVTSYLEGLLRLGVNRLSVGVQSFDEEDLKWMNRRHDADMARQALRMPKEAGFENISADLVFGLPGRDAAHWLEQVDRFIEADIPHLSAYALTVKPRTVLGRQVARGLVTPPTDDEVYPLFEAGARRLEEAGFEQYEVSSFGLPGFRSRHNTLYWTHANYLGFGPSAHSFRWHETGPQRRTNVSNLRIYLERMNSGEDPADERETLSPVDLAVEYVLLRLRTRDGLDVPTLRDRYGDDLEASCGLELRELEREGLVEWDRGRTVRLTRRGFALADAIAERLV